MRTGAGWVSLLAVAGSSLLRRPAKALALAGALALTIAAAAAVLFLTDALAAAAERVRAGAPDLVVQKMVAGRPATLDESVADRLKDIDGVRKVESRVWGYLFLPPVEANVVLVGARPSAPAALAPFGALASGRDLENDGEVILGATLAHALGLDAGDRIRLPTVSKNAPAELRIVGTFSSVTEVYASDVMLMREPDARALLGMGEREVTDIALSVANPAEARVVARTVLERVDSARIVDRALVARIHELAFGRRSGLAFAALLPALLALFVLGWDRLSSLGTEERLEVAVFKAVGFSTRDVVFVRMSESAAIAAAGAAVGIAIAYAWVFVFGAAGLRAAIAGFGVLQGDTPLVPAVDAAQLFGLALGVVGPFVVLSILPAWRAATVDPMQSMRA